MNWHWRCESLDGQQVEPGADKDSGPGETDFPTQADAETWLGENWRRLAAAGVDQVVLLEGDREAYGPMSLHPPS